MRFRVPESGGVHIAPKSLKFKRTMIFCHSKACATDAKPEPNETPLFGCCAGPLHLTINEIPSRQARTASQSRKSARSSATRPGSPPDPVGAAPITSRSRVSDNWILPPTRASSRVPIPAKCNPICWRAYFVDCCDSSFARSTLAASSCCRSVGCFRNCWSWVMAFALSPSRS